jgi:lysozyme
MKISKNGIDLITKFEGFKSRPYLCPSGIPTIGYGNTYYPDGMKVKISDPPVNENQANELLKSILSKFESGVNQCLIKSINQNQFDALVSFAFNIGMGNFKKSTLLKKVNINPVDPTIKNEFLRWNKSGGKVLNGLIRRRESEYSLYSR